MSILGKKVQSPKGDEGSWCRAGEDRPTRDNRDIAVEEFSPPDENAAPKPPARRRA